MADSARDIILSYANRSSLVKGVVLLGSFAVQQQTETSDLDILILLQNKSSTPKSHEEISSAEKKEGLLATFVRHQKELCNEFRNFIQRNNDNDKQTNLINTNEAIVSYECDILAENKTVIYVGTATRNCQDQIANKRGILKVDCGHAYDIMTNAKYIVGSEIKLKHLPHCILIDYCIDGGIAKKYIVNNENISQGEIFKQLSVVLSSPDPYASAGLMDNNPVYLIQNFVELFDNCCNDICKGDHYRAEFHLFILRHRLICLKLLSRDEKEHVYLPKMVYGRMCKIEIEKTDAYTSLLRLFIHFLKLNVESFSSVSSVQFHAWCCFLRQRIKQTYTPLKMEESFEILFKRVESNVQ